MQAVITVVGKDCVGILAKVCATCAENNVNVVEVTQRILGGMFAMIMIVDISACKVDFTAFGNFMKDMGTDLGVDVRCTQQELYEAMHHI